MIVTMTASSVTSIDRIFGFSVPYSRGWRCAVEWAFCGFGMFPDIPHWIDHSTAGFDREFIYQATT